MDPENDSIRADLESAFEQHTSEPTTPEETRGSAPDPTESIRDPAPPEGTPEPEGEEGRKRGPDGKFLPEDGTPPGEGGEPKGDAKPPEAGNAPSAEPPAPKAGEEALSAPVGWKPAARELWKNVPRQAQEEIVRREKETAQALSLSKNARQHFTDFNKVVGPFVPLIQAQNSTPLQAVRNLMTTAAGLSMGTMEQKAQIIREIIQNYGIDIETLDKVLAGSPVNPQQALVNPSNTPPQWAQPLFQFVNGVQSAQQQRQAKIRADAEATTEDFAAKHDFFEDLREDMADLMEVAARRGRVMSMDAAYEQALSMNPDISKIVQQRKAAARQNPGNAVARARTAASSVTGAPRQMAPNPSANSRRDDIAAAWDDANSR